MQEITINRKVFPLETLRGHVVKIEKRTFAEVSGGGGSVSTNPITGTSGRISAVRSEEKTLSEIWIQMRNGKQRSITVRTNIPVVDGNDVSIIMLAYSDKPEPIAVVNHDAQSYDIVNPKEISAIPAEEGAIGRLGCLISVGTFIICIIILSMIFTGTGSLMGSFFWSAIAAPIIFAFYYGINKSDMINKYSNDVRQIAKAEMAAPSAS